MWENINPIKQHNIYIEPTDPLRSLGEDSDMNTWDAIILRPIPKPITILQMQYRLIFWVNTRSRGPITSINDDKMMEYFLPIFSVIPPAKSAPIVPPSTAKLTNLYMDTFSICYLVRHYTNPHDDKDFSFIFVKLIDILFKKHFSLVLENFMINLPIFLQELYQGSLYQCIAKFRPLFHYRIQLPNHHRSLPVSS